jgi:hypothetical protein
VIFALLVCNGRPIGAGDTRPTERAAASLVQEGNLDLDEYAEVEPPFARAVGAHRVSIYPVLSAVLAAPVFALARPFFALDETGTALAGKAAASLFSALAAAALFVAIALRRTRADAWRAAAVFALGTSVWSTSQALWQHPAAVLMLALALVCLVLAEEDDRWAARAMLPLALALAARQADVALVGMLALAVVARWPRRIVPMLAWSVPVALAAGAYQWAYFGAPWRTGFSGTLGRFSESWGVGQAGLLLSPAKGLFVFTPIALVAIAGAVVAARRPAREVVSRGPGQIDQAYTRDDRWLARALLLALAAHWLLMGRWSEWHGGECFGPRMMTDALPLLFLFLPDGAALAPLAAGVLAVLSVGVQALGAFSYDYRWERLYQRPAAPGHPELWRIADSPLPFLLRERVAILAAPSVKDGRAFVREHRVVLGGRTGSRVSFDAGALRFAGSDDTVEDVHLLRGARIASGRLLLRGRWDGLFLRVREGARARPLELRIAGRGEGTLYVGEQSFGSDVPRWTAYPMHDRVLVRHPYVFTRSGGPDLVVTIGKSPGHAELERVDLVGASDPLDPFSLR